MTSIFPYLPEMIEGFGVGKRNVAIWAGTISAVFSLSQCLTAILWGRTSDTFGRKPTILAGLTLTMVTSILWGLLGSLPMALVVRGLAGACNGNVGIIRTMVAELVPEKELQPRAFSIMPLVWSLGSIFGPSFGGTLAKPAESYPDLFGHSRLFIKFPFLLPNLVVACFFLIGISTGILFLEETLETKRHKTDYGRELGKHLSSFLKRSFRPKISEIQSNEESTESSSLLGPKTSASTKSYRSTNTNHDSTTQPLSSRPPMPRPTLMEVFTRQSVINLIAYTFLALHSVTYDQLLPIFLHRAREVHTPQNTSLPFKFSGGFGFDHSRIGTIFTVYGIVGCFIQFLVFPPAARRFGVLNCFKVCGIVFPIVWFVTPFTSLIEDSAIQQGALCAIMVVRSFLVIFAFPCSVIMLTNSAVSLRVLGTLNGFSVSISAIGRAVGPAMGGAAFSWGDAAGYVITPYFLLGTVAAIGAIPIWFLVEMEGFSSTVEESEDDDGDDADEGEHRRGKSGQSSDRSIPGRKRSQSSVDSIAILESRMSNPVGYSNGGIGPGGGRRLSNGLAVSNLGQGTGGTSFT
ncbi:major facilitator superfamily domain-containing protein [Calycina marina]|uniref:Major facilitator superfamily domain-containing protein n=1 Tax=Calycina marina TaxID=1763456 RepID=A0A9P7YW38_9HELO|nr:major facilitator superfamily domain-containing protein [Calycina marina]